MPTTRPTRGRTDQSGMERTALRRPVRAAAAIFAEHITEILRTCAPRRVVRWLGRSVSRRAGRFRRRKPAGRLCRPVRLGWCAETAGNSVTPPGARRARRYRTPAMAPEHYRVPDRFRNPADKTAI